jgi:hypothetical protein
MKLYGKLIEDLDSSGERNSQDLNEVDLSDPEDVKVTVADNERSILVHLGDSDFRERFGIFKSHVREWRQQHANLQSVDLRYEHQVILNEDSQGNQPAKSVTVPKPSVKNVKKAAGRAKRR